MWTRRTVIVLERVREEDEDVVMRTNDHNVNDSDMDTTSDDVSTSDITDCGSVWELKRDRRDERGRLLCGINDCTTRMERGRVKVAAMAHGLCNNHYKSYLVSCQSSTKENLPPPLTPTLAAASSPNSFYPRKQYEELSESGKQCRKRQVRSVIDNYQVPLTELAPHSVSPSAIQHLGAQDRRALRDCGLSVPSDRRMKEHCEELDERLGAQCKEFPVGVYITDPIKFIRLLTAASSFLCVGGDSGGGTTKIGISMKTSIMH